MYIYPTLISEPATQLNPRLTHRELHVCTNFEGVDMDDRGKDLSLAATVNMDDWVWNCDLLTSEVHTGDFAPPLS